jgi:hypothetical protein
MDRVMSHVASADANGCRKWTGTTGAWGHGLVGGCGRRASPLRAHRVTYEDAFGPIPRGIFVLHACNVAQCVNPLHLYAGTAKQNTADMIRAGTFPRGERTAMAKLTIASVDQIRREYDGTETLRAVGVRYGVSAATIHRVIHRHSWAT